MTRTKGSQQKEKEATGMKLTTNEWLRGAGRQMKLGAVVGLLAVTWLLTQLAGAQAISTTTVQGTVYLANGQPGSGTLAVSWPAFTTANGQAVAADSMTVAIGADGFVSVNLAPNLSATPAGLYYTAVFYMSDGTTSTQYWIVPAAAQASLAQVQAQLMPAAQAVQAVSKAYVDQAISCAGTRRVYVIGRDPDGAALSEWRSDAGFAGRRQTLCGCRGRTGGSCVGRKHDRSVEHAGGERGAVPSGG